MSKGDKREHLAALSHAAAGPLAWHDADTAAGVCRGVPVRLRTETSRVGNRARLLVGGEVAVSLGGRTMAFEIDNRRRTVASLPEVLTGDAAFDELLMVQGWPEEALSAALDDETRSWLIERWPEGWPPLSVKDGHLTERIRVFRYDGHDEWTSAESFRADAEAAVALAQGMIRGYDSAREMAVSEGGEEGGRAWEATLAERAGSREQRRRTVRLAVFGGFVALCVAVIAAVLAGSGIL